MAHPPIAPKKSKSTRKAADAASVEGLFAPDAHGLKSLRPGFGRTSNDDVLFALGYPHIVVPTQDPLPDVKDVDQLYKRYPLKTTHVPRAFLSRYFVAVRKG